MANSVRLCPTSVKNGLDFSGRIHSAQILTDPSVSYFDLLVCFWDVDPLLKRKHERSAESCTDTLWNMFFGKGKILQKESTGIDFKEVIERFFLLLLLFQQECKNLCFWPHGTVKALLVSFPSILLFSSFSPLPAKSLEVRSCINRCMSEVEQTEHVHLLFMVLTEKTKLD